MKNNVKRIVVTGTIYNLFLNLLVIPIEEYAYVLFFTGGGIPKSIRQRLDNRIDLEETTCISKRRQLIYFIKYRLFRKLFLPHINEARIYAQDHLPFSSFIIGNSPYAFTEDAPNIFQIVEKQKYVKDIWLSKTDHKRITSLVRKMFNPLSGGIFANNHLCDEVVCTETCLPKYVDGKKITLVNLNELWVDSHEKKKTNILRIFGITDQDINNLSSRKIIVFTQPFFDDRIISLEEQINVYRTLLSEYNMHEVLIKTHPRDTIDYKEYFPKIVVFDKPIPMQLLDVIGIRFEEAATICSTAALSLPYELKVNWIGSKIHPNIHKEFGDFSPELKK